MTSNNLDFVARCMIGHNKTDIKSIKTELENVQKQVGTNKNNILFTATIGKCESTGGTANKVVTVSDVNYTPHKGSIIAVKFKYSNNVIDTVEHPITLNVNNTGAYRIWYKNGDYVNTSQGKIFGLSGYYIYYMYDGVDRWVWINYCMDNTYSLMPQTEASAGTATNERLISAKVLSDTIDEKLKTVETALNSKQNALSAEQLSAVNSGITSTDVAQIETNKNNISTANAGLIELVDSGAKNKIFVDKLNITNANGVTYTINSDGTITVNGTPSGSSPSYAVVAMPDGSTYKNFAEFCNGDNILSGCPTGGGVNTYRMYITGTGYTREDFGTGVELTDTSVSPLYLIIYIYNGYTADNLTFKPMICTKSAWDISHEYQPYAMSNAELTSAIQALQAQLANQ